MCTIDFQFYAYSQTAMASALYVVSG